MFSLLAMVLWLSLIITWRIKTRKFREAEKQFKIDFPALPFIGHLHYLYGNSQDRMAMLDLIGEQANKYDGWAKLWIGPILFGVVTDPVDIEFILKTHINKGDLLKLGQALTGDGIIFAPVHIWKPRRKVLVPVFNQRNLDFFMDIFHKQTSTLVECLKENVGKEAFSMWKYASAYTLDTAYNTMYGMDCSCQKNKNSLFVVAFENYLRLTTERLSNFLHLNETLFKYLTYFGSYKRTTECIKVIRNLTLKVINNRRAEKGKNQHIQRASFLDVLLDKRGEDGQPLPDQHLLEELSLVLIAATDTTAAATSFTLMLLARHPDIQEKLYQEIIQVTGNSDTTISSDDVLRLPYLQAVLKESLRMYPPVPITMRRIDRDSVTPSGIRLVKGMNIIINQKAIGYNRKYWGEDVNVFRPERFLEGYPTSPVAFLAFSHGPRMCPAYKYSMYSLTVVFTKMLKEFKILPAETDNTEKPIPILYSVFMKNPDRFPIKLEAR